MSPRDEFRYTGPDGHLRWFEIHRARTPGSLEVVGLIQDITERKQSLEALQASEARLDLAASAAGIGIWDWDLLSGRIIYCRRARAIMGLPPEGEVTEEELRRATHPDDLPLTTAQAARALDPAIRDNSPYDYRIIRPGGEVRHITAHGAAIFQRVDGVMKAVRYAGTLQDVTARRELERAKDDSQMRLKLAVDAGRMAIWEVDLSTGSILHSAELNRLLGFPEDARPSLAEVRTRYYPGERDRLAEAARGALRRIRIPLCHAGRPDQVAPDARRGHARWVRHAGAGGWRHHGHLAAQALGGAREAAHARSKSPLEEPSRGRAVGRQPGPAIS